MNVPSPCCQFTLHSAARSSTTFGIGTKMDSSGVTSMCCVKLIDAKKYEPTVNDACTNPTDVTCCIVCVFDEIVGGQM